MKIKDLPEQNRPRERFLKHGPEALSDAGGLGVIITKFIKYYNQRLL